MQLAPRYSADSKEMIRQVDADMFDKVEVGTGSWIGRPGYEWRTLVGEPAHEDLAIFAVRSVHPTPHYLYGGTCPGMITHDPLMTSSSGIGDPILQLFEDLYTEPRWDIPPIQPKNVRRVRAKARHRGKAVPLPLELEDD
jgi:hypothetical protein